MGATVTAHSRATVRPFAAADRGAVIAMLVGSEPWTRLGYTAADWERTLATPLVGREGFVLETGARVAGLALVRPRFLVGDYLGLFVVDAAVRGQGLGAALLEHVERVAFGRGQNLFVCVSDFNAAARRFYARQGYSEVGPLPDLLIRGSAEILLRKSRGPARTPG